VSTLILDITVALWQWQTTVDASASEVIVVYLMTKLNASVCYS
jgi:hypothetical protein